MNLDQIFSAGRTVFSLEIFPPKKTSSIDSVYTTIDELSQLKPDFISVTYGAGGTGAGSLTCKMASYIKEQGTESIAHLTCVNSTREEVLAALEDLKAHGVTNILALRGDKNPDIPPKEEFRYAYELIELIASQGGFHIAAACYPEGHPECGSLAQDVRHLKQKVDAGASHLISQLFFDNEDFYRFREMAAAAGIQVPIEAGIMPVTSRSQIERMVSMCGASIPKKLSRLLSRYGDDPLALTDAAIAYATDQIIDLIGAGVDGIHLYSMNNPAVARRIYENIKNALATGRS